MQFRGVSGYMINLTSVRLALGLCLLMLLQGASCVSDLSTQAAVENELPEPEPIDSTGVPIEKTAICLWNPVGLRIDPGQKRYRSNGESNIIASIYYGEMVELVDTPKVTVKDKDYLMVRLQDGQMGWVYEYLLEPHARRAAMIGEAELYRRPDYMTLRSDKLLPGQIVAVIEDLESPGKYGEWLHISSFEKKKKGWIRRENNLTFDPNEIQVALFLYRARIINSAEKRRRALGELLGRDIAKNSVFRPMIEEEFKKTESQVDPKTLADEIFDFSDDRSDKLFVTQANVWLYTQPDEEAGEGIQQLSENDVCIIIERGERVTIDEMDDYWYRVSYEGVEGWVFGYYTSRRELN